MKNISILGSTGSIGTQTLEIVRNNKDINVSALAAYGNIELLEKQIREFKPEIVCVYDENKAKVLKENVKDLDIKVVTKMEGLIETATCNDAEIVVTAVVGMIGIRPTIEAIKAGKDIALANKETLVTALLPEVLSEDIQRNSLKMLLWNRLLTIQIGLWVRKSP